MEKQTEKKSIKNRIVSAAWQLFYEKGYNGTTVDDIIELSGTSKGSFYYYFNTKDELLNTLSLILDDYYEELEAKMDPEMNSFFKLLYLNCEMHTMMEEKISIDLLASLYSTQLVAEGQSHHLAENGNGVGGGFGQAQAEDAVHALGVAVIAHIVAVHAPGLAGLFSVTDGARHLLVLGQILQGRAADQALIHAVLFPPISLFVWFLAA